MIDVKSFVEAQFIKYESQGTELAFTLPAYDFQQWWGEWFLQIYKESTILKTRENNSEEFLYHIITVQPVVAYI